MDTKPDEPDDAEADDVAGHLRMTDDQLASGTTPKEALAQTPPEKKHRGGDR